MFGVVVPRVVVSQCDVLLDSSRGFGQIRDIACSDVKADVGEQIVVRGMYESSGVDGAVHQTPTPLREVVPNIVSQKKLSYRFWYGAK